MNKRIILNLSGRVQGVSFRINAIKEAQKLSLTGFVKNEIDGSLSIVAEGDSKNLDPFLEWAKHGPRGAYVKKINIKLENPTNKFDDFLIQY